MRLFKLAIAAVAAFTLTITASAKQLVPVGQTVGVKLFSQGVMVVGVEDENGSVLEKGDVITRVNNSEVDTAMQLKELVTASGGDELCLTVNRDGKELEKGVKPEYSDGVYKLGVWIRDSIAGIGTVTFFDPATGCYGALGHGVNDVSSGRLMPLEKGSIMEARVASVKKGEPGSPGQLTGSFDTMTELGNISANTDGGIFGKLLSVDNWQGGVMETASADEVENGPAYILSNISADSIERYDVEIVKKNDNGDSRNMIVKVTDQRLLEQTGGIVQGMSGSPIIQNGKLIGAVTHVLVGDPTRGYGIYIDNMLDHGGINN